MSPSFDNATLEKQIRISMRKYNTPGLAISILKENEIIYSKGFGSRDLQQFLPMTGDTLIGIGSISKSFTAFAILKLEEMGKLNIQDSVSKYLNYPPFSNHPDITITHLLSHSSGIPAADGSMTHFNYSWGDFSKVYPTTSKEDFEAFIGEPEEYIIFKPGEKFYYNNDMYTCLSFIIEKVSGLSYTEFLSKEILKPLEMNRAVLSKAELEKDPNHMLGYQPFKEGEKMVMKQYEVPIGGYLEAGGGLYVSMNEMMQYAECLLNKGMYRGKQLLKPQTIEKLWTPQIESPYGYGAKKHYGLGLVVEKEYFKNYTFIHHGGGMGTSCAFFCFIPELKLAVCCAQNSCTGPTSVYNRIAISLLLGLNPNKQVTFLEKSKLLEEITGTYKSSNNLYSFIITVKNGIVNVDYEIDDGKFNTQLILKNLEKLEFVSCNSLLETEQKITFFRNKGTNKIEFVNLDRYLYKKI